MIKLLKWAVLFLGIAAVVAFVPIHGRTAVDRWRKAGSASAFIHDLYLEMRQPLRRPPEKPERMDRPGKPATRPATARRPAAHPHNSPPATNLQPAAKPGQSPVENHSAADHAAIDRLVADRLK